MLVSEIVALPVFPYADTYRYMTEKEILALADDIENKGLIHRPVLWRGQLLDGRNRLRALQMTSVVDVEVKDVSHLTEFEAVDYVLSVNEHRRHESVTERAIAAVAYLPYWKGLPGKATEKAAERHGISGPSVVRAKRISQSPVGADLWEKMKAGTLEVTQAYDQLLERQAKFEANTEVIREFPEVWSRYQSGELAHHEAYSEAQRVDAAQKKAREKGVSETVLVYRFLTETPLWDEAAIGVGKLDVAGAEQAEKAVAELLAQARTAEWAVGRQLAWLREQDQG